MDKFILPTLKPRPIDGHKGTFGTVGILGGSVGQVGLVGQADTPHPRMIGAPALVALGANSTGCGLVKIGAPEPILTAILTLAPMATGYSIATTQDGHMVANDAASVFGRLIEESDALVIGPGMGTRDDASRLMEHALKTSTMKRCRSMVIDADAITVLCQDPPILNSIQHIPAVLTPHPGEAQRLLDALGFEGNPTGNETQRIEVCTTLAKALKAIVVLKGQGTVVSDGHRHWVCTHGHPCLATGGTGDVLAGMIGSVIAQGLDNLTIIDVFACACIAVDVHGLAGEMWAMQNDAQAGLDPRALCALIPRAMQTHRNSPNDDPEH